MLVSGHRGLAMLWDSQTSRVLATLKGLKTTWRVPPSSAAADG